MSIEPTFDVKGNCPICKRSFRHSDCPHGYGEVVNFLKDKQLDKRIRAIVHEELRKAQP